MRVGRVASASTGFTDCADASATACAAASLAAKAKSDRTNSTSIRSHASRRTGKKRKTIRL
jgi:hypothetical protein